MLPAISVVIPLYNKRDYIERCLRSVRAQTFEDYQIVVVNDGSTDGCERLAEPFLQEGDLLINQENRGHAAARNCGLGAATAGILASLDADDEWLPEHLTYIHELSKRFPEAGLLSTGVRMRMGRLARDTLLASAEPRLVNYFRISIGAYALNSSSLAIRKEVFERLGGFLLDEPVGADREYWARIALHWPVALYPEVASVYYKDASGTAILRKGFKGRSGLHLIYGTLEKALQDGRVPAEIEADVRAYAAAVRIEHAWSLIRRGRVKQAADVISHESMLSPEGRRSARLLKAYVTLTRRIPEGSRTSILLGTALCSFTVSPGRLFCMALGMPRRQGELTIWERFVRESAAS